MPEPSLADQLVGRDHELSRLVSCAAEATAGHGQAVLIEGEPGIGKSTLVRAAWRRPPDWGARCSGAPVTNSARRCHCYPSWTGCGSASHRTTRGRKPSSRCCGARSPPGGARMCRPRWRSSCWRSSANCARGADGPGRGRSPVGRSCQRHPVGAAIPVGPAPAAAAGGHDAPGAATGGSAGPPAYRRPAARFQLGGLPEGSVTELVGTLAGGKPDEELMRLADGAAGNPLYLTELVDALARSSSLTVSDAGTAELTSGHAPGHCPPRSRTGSASSRPGCGRCCAPRPCSAWISPCPTWPPCSAGAWRT